MRWYGWTVTEYGCWEWNGQRNDANYGVFKCRKRFLRAHRVAYEVFVGPIPEGLEIRHRCDNPPCMNPKHLVPGTHGDNVRDMHERGRAPKPNAVLSQEKVDAIRTCYASGDITQRALAMEYAVSYQQISRIIRRENWK